MDDHDVTRDAAPSTSDERDELFQLETLAPPQEADAMRCLLEPEPVA